MKKDISLYIHIPFCKQKCAYCDFNSCSGMDKYMVDYAKALSKEMDTLQGYSFKTVFIGGGTPTYMSLEGWKYIAESFSKLKLEKGAEITVEGNPGTFDREKLIFLKKMGVNRLSIGLQAWQNSHLRKLGRIHSVEDFVSGYNLARDVGFENINVDLMFGLPEQSMEQWKETLEKVVELNPEHLSCYGLIVEEATLFYRLNEENKLPLPSEDLERQMYGYTVEYLGDHGFMQYEISNYSKPGKECKHNLVYWNLGEYIGCGTAAHSYTDSKRYSNEEDIKKYIYKSNKNECLVVETYENSAEDNIEEFIFMGLRKMQGISKTDFSRRFQCSFESIYEQVFSKHIKNGNLINEGDMVYFSEGGISISNSVLSDFILDKKNYNRA